MSPERQMSTCVCRVPLDAGTEHPVIQKAASIIQEGGLVAFPTETVYGLGANGLDAAAARRIFEAKQRPLDNPIILHVSGIEGLFEVAEEVPATSRELVECFWPGPLTVIVPRASNVPDAVTGGLNTVAVRCPSHPTAQALIRAAGVPIAAPSANVSGRPSPTCAEHVLADLDGKLKLVLDAGPTGIGVESTVVEAAGDRAVVLRPGGLPVESIKKVVSEVVPGQGVEFDETPSSPGLKYTHYSPEASLFLVDCGTRGRTVECLKREAARAAGLGRRVGILCARESAEHYRELEAEVQHLGSYSVLKEVAAKLFWALRELDNRGCEVVFAEGFPKRELGLAVMDRLTRAADRVITDQEELS